MVIKINLLPPYIHEKRKRNVAIGVVTVLVAAEVAGLVMAANPPRQKRDALLQQQTETQKKLTDLQALGTKFGTVAADEAKFRPKFDFITQMLEYNKEYPSLYARTAGYTYRDVMYLNLEASNNLLKFNAYVTSPADVSRLLLGLTRSGDIQGLPQIAGVPGYSQQEKLREQQMSEDVPGGSQFLGYDQYTMGGAPGFGGVSDMPGGPGMMPGGSPSDIGGPSFMGTPGQMVGSAVGGGMMGGGGNGPAGAGDMGSGAAYGPAGDMPGGPGMMGGGMGDTGGGTGGGLGALNLAGARKRPKGFLVTVSCPLRTAIFRPSYGNAGAAQAGGMGMGMGMPGGYSDMPGGGMPGMAGGGMPGMAGNGP